MSVWDVVVMLCCRALSVRVVPPLDRVADVADGVDKIPLQNVDARILAKVIEYMKYHYKLTETPQPEDEVRRWDREFVRVDKSTLFHLVLVRFIQGFWHVAPLLRGLCWYRVFFSGLLFAWCLARCAHFETSALSLSWLPRRRLGCLLWAARQRFRIDTRCVFLPLPH